MGSCAIRTSVRFDVRAPPGFLYSSASKTRSPVPCSPSRITAHSLPLTSSIPAVNKYRIHNSLPSAHRFPEPGRRTEKSPLGRKERAEDENRERPRRYYLLIKLLQRYEGKQHITFTPLFSFYLKKKHFSQREGSYEKHLATSTFKAYSITRKGQITLKNTAEPLTVII